MQQLPIKPVGDLMSSFGKFIAEVFGDRTEFFDNRNSITVQPKKVDPEKICEHCGGDNPTWSADNGLWNEVNGSPNGIMCPKCFEEMAENKGIGVILRVERI